MNLKISKKVRGEIQEISLEKDYAEFIIRTPLLQDSLFDFSMWVGKEVIFERDKEGE